MELDNSKDVEKICVVFFFNGNNGLGINMGEKRVLENLMHLAISI